LVCPKNRLNGTRTVIWVLWKLNTVSTDNSELYAYDDLNRLTSFERGTLTRGDRIR